MKAKYKILRLLVIFAMILSLGSCKKDFLQTVPTDAISTDIVLSSTENMMLALNGIHRTLYGQNGRIRYYAGQQYVIPLVSYTMDRAYQCHRNRYGLALVLFLQHYRIGKQHN